MTQSGHGAPPPAAPNGGNGSLAAGTPRRPLEQLHAASNRLWYEYWMLRSTARLRADDPATALALAESFALHARNLLEFLYADADPDADAAGPVTAGDFLGGRWRQLRPARPQLLIDVAAWARQTLAPLEHGSLTACAETARPWTLVDASFEIQKVMDPFISSAPRELLGSRWKIRYEDVDV